MVFHSVFASANSLKKNPVSNCMYCNLVADYNVDFSPDRLWKQQQQEEKQTNKHSKKYPTIKMQGGCKQNHKKLS